jgi:putative FmdB family regulatory protein
MPTYEYRCDACGFEFEKFQSISAVPIRKCPACGKNRVKRLLGTGAGIIFKGSGFYITDYRDPSYKDKAKAESGAAPSGESKPAASADAKPTAEAKPATSEKPAAGPGAKIQAKHARKSSK